MGEGDERGWYCWMASPTQWTWVWVNSGSWGWTGRLGVLQSVGLQKAGHDWATELNQMCEFRCFISCMVFKLGPFWNSPISIISLVFYFSTHLRLCGITLSCLIAQRKCFSTYFCLIHYCARPKNTTKTDYPTISVYLANVINSVPLLKPPVRSYMIFHIVINLQTNILLSRLSI